MPESNYKQTLGKSDIQISAMGVGAWAWGDRLMWSYGQDHQASDVQDAFQTSLEAGINLVDTAEVYGLGRSERILSSLVKEQREMLVIASKFMPFPWRLTRNSMLRALRNSLKRLELEKLDLYQIHFPMPPVSVETWAQALADTVEMGLTRSVGVSNYNEQQMRAVHAVLAKRGIPLVSNQVEYHLLNRKVELNGLLKACQELGVTLIAYSPLAQGLLTGKYTPQNPPPGLRKGRYSKNLLVNIQPLLNEMKRIGEEQGGKTPAQVALNWLIYKGTVPIPGAKNANQAKQNSGGMGWLLPPEQVERLDRFSLEVQ